MDKQKQNVISQEYHKEVKKQGSYKVPQWSLYLRSYLMDGYAYRSVSRAAPYLWCERTREDKHCNSEDEHSLPDSLIFKQTHTHTHARTSTGSRPQTCSHR